jgi:hypothetical protein
VPPGRIAVCSIVVAKLGISVMAAGIGAGGLLTAVWAAARVAVSPGHPAPRIGLDLVLGTCRAVTGLTLEPIIGASGSPPIFWATLAVFLALFTLTAVRATASLSRVPKAGGPSAALPPALADPVVVSLPWHHPAVSPARPHGPAAPRATHHVPTPDPGIATSNLAPGDAAHSHFRPTVMPARHDRDSTAGAWVSIGVAGDQPVDLDLCAYHGLGVTGPGADGCARHLIASLLTHTEPATAVGRDAEAALVVIPAADATRLLAATTEDVLHDPALEPRLAPESTPLRAASTDRAEPGRLSRRLYQAPTLGLALTYLEQQLLARARTNAQPDPQPHAGSRPGAGAPVVLFARPDPASHARLQAILAHGGRYRIAAVVTGAWPTGTTLSLERDGTVHTHATSPTTQPATSPALSALTTANTASIHDLQTLLRQPIHPDQPTTTAPPTPNTTTPNARPVATHPTRDSATATADRQPSRDEPTSPGDVRSPAPTPPPSSHDAHRARCPAPPPQSAYSGEATDALRDRDSRHRHGPRTCATGPVDGDTADPPTDPAVAVVAPLDRFDAQAVLLVNCFGGLRVHARADTMTGNRRRGDDIAGGDITALLSRQDARLLACLALHPQGIPAGSLLEIGWPGAQPHSGGQRLRTALNHLRTALREATDRPDVTFVGHLHGRYHLGAHPNDPHIWVDYAAFDTAIQTVRSPSAATRLEALRTMAALYTGTLLRGIDLDWPELSALQESARRAATAASASLAEHYARSDPAQAAELLRSLLTHEPAAE